MSHTLCLLTDHLQGVDIDVATHHAALGVQFGAAQAHGHADLTVSVAAHRQPSLTLQPAGRPSAGGGTEGSGGGGRRRGSNEKEKRKKQQLITGCCIMQEWCTVRNINDSQYRQPPQE